WMASPGHKANIMNPSFKQAGFAPAKGNKSATVASSPAKGNKSATVASSPAKGNKIAAVAGSKSNSLNGKKIIVVPSKKN
ncbi:22283_t:CDS:2, partial [Dentiscutata erythropus]